MTYTLTQFPTIIVRDEDQAFIPSDADNVDYQEYVAWLAKGNQPAPYEPPSRPDLPIEEPPAPDIADMNVQLQDVDQRLTALEEEVRRG